MGFFCMEHYKLASSLIDLVELCWVLDWEISEVGIIESVSCLCGLLGLFVEQPGLMSWLANYGEQIPSTPPD